MARAFHTAQRSELAELVSICRGGVVPTPRWHVILTQRRRPGSQRFFGSAEQRGVAGWRAPSPRQPSGTLPGRWRSDKSPPGTGDHAQLQAPHSLGCSRGRARSELLGQRSTPARAFPPGGRAAGGTAWSSLRGGRSFPSGQTRWSQRLGHPNPCSPPVRGLAPR